jgi:hypothetical protein
MEHEPLQIGNLVNYSWKDESIVPSAWNLCPYIHTRLARIAISFIMMATSKQHPCFAGA